MEDNRLSTTDILPFDPLGMDPGEVHPIWISLYKCPFCERITEGLGFNGTSVDEYAVDEEGTLYRKFEPVIDGAPEIRGCICGRGVWIASKDRCNISTIWDTLNEEQFGSSLSAKLLQ